MWKCKCLINGKANGWGPTVLHNVFELLNRDINMFSLFFNCCVICERGRTCKICRYGWTTWRRLGRTLESRIRLLKVERHCWGGQGSKRAVVPWSLVSQVCDLWNWQRKISAECEYKVLFSNQVKLLYKHKLLNQAFGYNVLFHKEKYDCFKYFKEGRTLVDHDPHSGSQWTGIRSEKVALAWNEIQFLQTTINLKDWSLWLYKIHTWKRTSRDLLFHGKPGGAFVNICKERILEVIVVRFRFAVTLFHWCIPGTIWYIYSEER